MRRIPAVLLLCLGIALTGAAPSRPAATPAPKPPAKPAAKPSPGVAPTSLPHEVSLPIIVVYPFETSSEIPASNGVKAANLFVQVMNNAGGLDAIGAPATIKHANYLGYARTVNADYYVTGYMTPLGTGVSLVEQVVSTRSGTMVFGQTAQIDSFEDAAAQADTVHDGIMAQENAFKQAYKTAQATATATPMPQNQANIGRGIADIAGLFHHKGKSAPAAVAKVDKPDKGIIVAHVTGSVPANNLSAATSDLSSALNTYYNVRSSNANGAGVSRSANAICGTNRDNTIATGSLSAKTSRHGLIGVRTEWTFKLQVYTCWGAQLSEHAASAGSIRDAVTGAVEAYAKAHPQNS